MFPIPLSHAARYLSESARLRAGHAPPLLRQNSTPTRQEIRGNSEGLRRFFIILVSISGREITKESRAESEGDPTRSEESMLETIHPTGYRYTANEGLINYIKQNGKLPSDDWYCSFDRFDGTTLGRSELQLPPPPNANTAKYRVEFATNTVKDHIRIPYGETELKGYLEPAARDFPGQGIGGGTQVKIEGEIPVTAIWDISGSTLVRVYP